MKQRGVALLVVLLVVAIVTVLATEMGTRLQLQVKRSTNIKDSNQAYWYAMGAEQYARNQIVTLINKGNGVVALGQPWATEKFQYPLPNGSIEAKLEDMQSCFNLNSLGELNSPNTTGDKNANKGNNGPTGKGNNTGQTYTPAKALQTLLLSLPDSPVDDFSAEVLTYSLKDWLDADNQISGNFGAEDDDYRSHNPPYLTADTLMIDKSELRLVRGADPAWLGKVMPLLCAIPNEVHLKINVNTIDQQHLPVLRAALGNQISIQDVANLINDRPPKGYQNISDFFSQPEISRAGLNKQHKSWFDITTSYFMLHITARFDGATFRMTSVLKIDQQHQVSVIRRNFGGAF